MSSGRRTRRLCCNDGITTRRARRENARPIYLGKGEEASANQPIRDGSKRGHMYGLGNRIREGTGVINSLNCTRIFGVFPMGCDRVLFEVLLEFG